MKVVCLLAIVGLVACQLLDLGESTFDSALAEHSGAGLLVKFYAPWCGHCKAMAPAFKEAADEMGAGGARLAKVDCTEHQGLCSKFGIQGYPTLKFFRGADIVEYQGPRDAAGIQKWIKKKTAPAPTFDSREQLKEFTSSVPRAVVAFFRASDKNAEVQTLWNSLKSNPELEDFDFGETYSSDLADLNGIDKSSPAILIFTAGVAGPKYSGSFAAALDWIDDNAFPLVTDISNNRFPKLAQKKKFVVVLFTGENEQTEIDLLSVVGKEFSDSLGFVHGVGQQYAQHASMLGISGKVFPVLVGIKQDKYFPSPEDKEFNEANLKAWLSDLASGNLKANFKSEPVPESQDGPVTIVVGHNFEAEVLNSNKHVFLEFYAPWCGHCKNLAPVWDQLGEKYKGTDVVIAKIDATNNDHPIAGVTGFPTLKFFPKGDKENPIDYDGGARSLEDLSAFIESQRSGTGNKEEL